MLFGFIYFFNKKIKNTSIFKEVNKKMTNVLKAKNAEFIILFLILFLGLVVRLYKIDNPIADWHSFRQADTASVTRFFVQDGINLLMPRYHDISRVQSGRFNPQGYRFVEFPIGNAIHAFFAKKFEFFSLEKWGRLLSVFYGLITGTFVYLIGKKLYGKKFGFIAMSFFLFLPFNIYFTRVILPEPLAVMFAVISLWFFLVYKDNQDFKMLFLSSLALSFGILVKPYVIFYGLPIAFYFYNKYKIGGSLKNPKLLFCLAIILVPIILWRIWMQQFPEGIPFWKWTFNGDAIRFKPAFWRWIFGERLGYLILGVWGVFPFAFGLADLRRKADVIITSLMGAFLYTAVIATANVRHDYYQTFIIPVICLVLAKGVINLWHIKYGTEWVRKLLVVFSLIFAFLVSASQIKEFYKINHPEIIEAGEAVDRLTPKNAIVIAAYNGDTAFLYQTKRRGWPVVELPINELIDEGASYYTSVNLNDAQTQEFMKEFRILEKTNTYVVLDLKQTP